MSIEQTVNKSLDTLDKDKSFKTQIIIGLGFFILTTFLFFWMGVRHEGLIAGDMTALILGAFYVVYLDRTKIKYTNRLMSGLIILAVVRAAVAISVSASIV